MQQHGLKEIVATSTGHPFVVGGIMNKTTHFMWSALPIMKSMLHYNYTQV
jgi:hypothetical protein